MTEPRRLIVQWLRTVVPTGVHVSTQFDPARGLPQVVVPLASLRVPVLGDNRGDPSLHQIDVAVIGFGAGGDRPDFAGAFDAVAPALHAANELPAVRWMADDGTMLVNANNVLATQSVDGDTNCATVTVTATVTYIVPPTPPGS
jgi:hypothetical protein